jgi:hypothetical protein
MLMTSSDNLGRRLYSRDRALPETPFLLEMLVDATFRKWSDAHYIQPSQHEREWFEQFPSRCLLPQLKNFSPKVSRSKRHQLLVLDNYLGEDGGSSIESESDSMADVTEF